MMKLSILIPIFPVREPSCNALRQTLSVLDGVAPELYHPLLKKVITPCLATNPPPRILEIGAGIGTLTECLLDYGHVVATDISAPFLESLRTRLSARQNLQVRVWDATTPPWEGAGKFDLIVAFNVLEHIEDDENAIRCWASLLRPNGRLALLVPNYPSLHCPIDRAVGHYRRYGIRALGRRLSSAGVEVEHYYYGNPLGILGWIVNGLILRRATLPAGQLRLYALFKRYLGGLEKIVEKFAGLSILAVVHRPAPPSRS